MAILEPTENQRKTVSNDFDKSIKQNSTDMFLGVNSQIKLTTC